MLICASICTVEIFAEEVPPVDPSSCSTSGAVAPCGATPFARAWHPSVAAIVNAANANAPLAHHPP